MGADVSTDDKYLQHDFAPSDWNPWAMGWTVELAREAITHHDLGDFGLSSVLGIASTRFAPVLAALEQRVDAPLGLARHTVPAGPEGLAAVAGQELAALYAGAEPLHGDMFAAKAMMGFSVLTHTWTPSEDASLLVPTTRVWPTSAIRYERITERFQAITRDGPVDIVDGDGKWTIVGSGAMPHLRAAVRAIGLQYLKGGLADRDEAALSEFVGRNTFFGILPEKIVLKSDEGKEIGKTIKDMGRARSGAVYPHGTTVGTTTAASDKIAVFDQMLKRCASYVAMALLGQDGTVQSGSGGVYQSPIFKGIAFSLLRSDVTTAGAAFTRGVGRPYVLRNYGDEKLLARYEWLLPDLDEAERRKAIAEGHERFLKVVDLWSKTGFEVTQDAVDELAAALGVRAPKLRTTSTAATSFAYDQENGVITINDRRQELGRDPVAWGNQTVPEYRASIAAKQSPPEAGSAV